MEILNKLKMMNEEERKLYIKEYFKKLKEIYNNVKDDKKKLEALAKKLGETGKDEEILAILLLSIVPDEYFEDVVDLYPLLQGILLSHVMKQGFSILKLIKKF